MEVLGAIASGVTLAALFKHSFEALDLIHLYQTQDVDFNRLQLHYKLEKCRLYNWGVEMGLADDSKQNLLSEWHSKELVAEALQQVINFLLDHRISLTKLAEQVIALFSDVLVIRKKYGCVDVTSLAAPSLPAPETSHGIASAFDYFKIQSSNCDENMSRLKKAKWVIHDRKKFHILISEVRSLIDCVEKITNNLSSSARLEEILRIRIGGITNIDTLLGIASVWRGSHPRVASTASTKAESISIFSGRYNFISQWQDSVDSEASGDTLIADVEDLTITELKHFVLSSKQEIETLKEKVDKYRFSGLMISGVLALEQFNSLQENAKSRYRLRNTIFAVCAISITSYFSVCSPGMQSFSPSNN